MLKFVNFLTKPKKIIKFVVAFCTIRALIFCRDSCIPQKKNKILSWALLKFFYKENNLKKLTQIFSEPAHPQIQEIDDVQSAISPFLKLKEIQSQLDFIRKSINLKTKL